MSSHYSAVIQVSSSKRLRQERKPMEIYGVPISNISESKVDYEVDSSPNKSESVMLLFRQSSRTLARAFKHDAEHKHWRQGSGNDLEQHYKQMAKSMLSVIDPLDPRIGELNQLLRQMMQAARNSSHLDIKIQKLQEQRKFHQRTKKDSELSIINILFQQLYDQSQKLRDQNEKLNKKNKGLELTIQTIKKMSNENKVEQLTSSLSAAFSKIIESQTTINKLQQQNQQLCTDINEVEYKLEAALTANSKLEKLLTQSQAMILKLQQDHKKLEITVMFFKDLTAKAIRHFEQKGQWP